MVKKRGRQRVAKPLRGKSDGDPEMSDEKPIDYQRRNDFLADLGFNSYSHYLNSDMWQTIRRQVLDRDAYQCVVCGRNASDVHHNSYELDVLIGKDLDQLVSLCRHHHKSAEFAPGMVKRELPEVRQVLQSQGVKMPPLVHLKKPKCLLPPSDDPFEGMTAEERDQHIEDCMATLREMKRMGRAYRFSDSSN